MKTLKEQLEQQGIEIMFKTQALNQPCEFISEAIAMDGSRLIQINCFQTESKHPAETIGKTVIVIEDNQFVEIDSKTYNPFFNK